MFVDVSSWRRVVEGEKADAERGPRKSDKHRLHFLSMLRPHLFWDAILLGANIKDSLLYRWLGDHGFPVRWGFPADCREPAQNAGPRRPAAYLLSDPRQKPHEDSYGKAASGTLLIDQMDRVVAETFAGEPFLYVANNDRKSAQLDDS